jgi:hypothetical protein
MAKILSDLFATPLRLSTQSTTSDQDVVISSTSG